jgi:hypothetical protein
VAGRTWDFIPGYNLTTKPRYDEPITFATLRALAESYDPLHLVIERRKDQVCRLPWSIRVKHDDHSKAIKRPKASELPKETIGRIKEITQFFKKPDGELTFRSWLRALIEDLLVTDAPTLYCSRTRGGQLLGLWPVDGSTIKRVIDDWGRTPKPVEFNGDPFMWNGELVTLENHQANGFKLMNGFMYPPAYQQILKGLPAVNYTTRDLYYRPNNLRPGRVYGIRRSSSW